jgi:predicted RNA-binding Zn-ribbon protein involved in translation (DUF1610 family)
MGVFMQRRYACFKIRTTCGSCGQSIPINGPYLHLSCSSCFKEISISDDVLSGFLNCFDEDHESLARLQGSGGTLMCGSGVFNYSYWKIEPGCSKCKTLLPLPAEHEAALIHCAECGEKYSYHPVPEWLKLAVPSAVFCVTPGLPPGDDGAEVLEVDEASLKPIVMSCPQCGGALSVSSESQRVMGCSYCSSEVYIPDGIWQRLHPVRKALEWFVGFEGKSKSRLDSERRLRDKQDEREELASRNPLKTSKKPSGMLMILLVIAVTLALQRLVVGPTGSNSVIDPRLTSVLSVLFLGITAVIIILSVYAKKRRNISGYRLALAALADKHGWKLCGDEGKRIGSIRAEHGGRTIEIEPDDHYLIRVGITSSPFYLNTEPVCHPSDSMRRFTTGDSRFDKLFPIRYAEPGITQWIESSGRERDRTLAPFIWFIDRWGKRLDRIAVNWSRLKVHPAWGFRDRRDSSGGCNQKNDPETLLEDMITLAVAVEAVGSGREPELP